MPRWLSAQLWQSFGQRFCSVGLRSVWKIFCLLPTCSPRPACSPSLCSLLRAGILVENPQEKKRQSKSLSISPRSNLLTTQLHCRREDFFLSCLPKAKRQSKSICARKGALRREQRAVDLEGIKSLPCSNQ